MRREQRFIKLPGSKVVFDRNYILDFHWEKISDSFYKIELCQENKGVVRLEYDDKLSMEIDFALLCEEFDVKELGEDRIIKEKRTEKVLGDK